MHQRKAHLRNFSNQSNSKAQKSAAKTTTNKDPVSGRQSTSEAVYIRCQKENMPHRRRNQRCGTERGFGYSSEIIFGANTRDERKIIETLLSGRCVKQSRENLENYTNPFIILQFFHFLRPLWWELSPPLLRFEQPYSVPNTYYILQHLYLSHTLAERFITRMLKKETIFLTALSHAATATTL